MKLECLAFGSTTGRAGREQNKNDTVLKISDAKGNRPADSNYRSIVKARRISGAAKRLGGVSRGLLPLRKEGESIHRADTGRD